MPKANLEKLRRYREEMRAKIAEMPKIPCQCGCGTLIKPMQTNYTPSRYARGHQPQSKQPRGPAWNRVGERPLTGAEKRRRYYEKRLAEIEQMPKIPCACGCGTLIAPINKKLKPATYVRGHQPGGEATRFKLGNPSPWKGKQNPALTEANYTRERKPEEAQKRNETRRARYGPAMMRSEIYQRVAHRKLARIARGPIVRDIRGPNNPFFGKKHTPEARQKMSEKLSGPKHPGWRGGTATLPYGPGFTRKQKRLILQRDNYTCQRCGITQEAYGRALQVHHLDHNKDNNDSSNLVAACGSCNVWASYHRNEPFTP